MHIFLLDYIRYLIDFRLNRRAIYQGERVHTYDDIIFEKTDL